MNTAKHHQLKRIIGIILFCTLILSIIYALTMYLLSPSQSAATDLYKKVKTDYLLMLTQCVLGLIVMMLPAMLERKWKLPVPNAIVILYYCFLYCAIYLGEVKNFYYLIPHWDDILHGFSGAMLGALGFILVDILNKDPKVKVQLSPIFVSLFAFCFALAVGALWEVYEFAFDALLGLNMQKHTTEAGVALVGIDALSDTMIDIIVDACSSLIVSILGFFAIRKKS